MKRICVATATRAEYGLLVPLMRRIMSDEDLELDLIVTGGHLSDKQGHTIDCIIEDGFPIAHKIVTLENDNTPFGISITAANTLKGFAKCFREDRPDMVVILGDRTEMLGVAFAAMNEQIPIAHIHGGEITEGAVDDCVRHAITKMSYLHLTSTEIYRRRVIQLGEDPERVYNVGGLGVENIRCIELLSEDEIHAEIGIPSGQPYAVVTYHPETIIDRGVSVTEMNKEVLCMSQTICDAMEGQDGLFYIVTASNTDAGGDIINKVFSAFCEKRPGAVFIRNLGTKRYLSAIKHAAFVLGNSSSGILEAPVFGTPTVNVGYRQKGRIRPDSVIDCDYDIRSIMAAMDKAKSMSRMPTDVYGDGKTSEKIVSRIKDVFSKGNGKIDLRKRFFDMESTL